MASRPASTYDVRVRCTLDVRCTYVKWSAPFELQRWKVKMVEETDVRSGPRAPWNRAQLLRAAIDLADERGIESLSMRKLSQAARRRNDVAVQPRLQQGRPP